MKLLIVEDEQDLRSSMVEYLDKEGFVCEEADSFRSAEDKLAVYKYDIAILDLNLPDGNGLDLLAMIKKQKPETGILIVSARDALDDRVKGLDMGADDYITKPFHLAELNARIHALIRRRNFDGKPTINFNEIQIDPAAKTVRVNDQTLDLTKKEFDLLVYLVINKNRVLSKESIAEHLWGDNIDMVDSFDFVYTHIKNLRKKILEADGTDYIKTVYGMGYKLAV